MSYEVKVLDHLDNGDLTNPIFHIVCAVIDNHSNTFHALRISNNVQGVVGTQISPLASLDLSTL
jgi:hypothetical protein